MSTANFRTSKLFKCIPWQTSTPETLDATQLPSEAQRFRDALMECGQAHDLERFCLTSENLSEYPILNVFKRLNDYSTSSSQRERICSSILQYRVIDLLSCKQGGPQRNFATDMSSQRCHLPNMSHLPIAQLKTWYNILIAAKKSSDAHNEPIITLPNSTASGTFMHLNRIAQIGQKAVLLKVMANIDAASMHLRYLLEGNKELPECLDAFTEHLVQQNPNVPRETVVSVMGNFNMAKLRVPLNAAMAVSPLCLLANTELLKKSISEEKFCDIWWAQGHNRPSLLQQVESEIFRIVWDNATRTINLHDRLQRTLPKLIKNVEDNIRDPALHWFNDAYMFSASTPVAQPVTAFANPSLNLERREEEEEEEDEVVIPESTQERGINFAQGRTKSNRTGGNGERENQHTQDQDDDGLIDRDKRRRRLERLIFGGGTDSSDAGEEEINAMSHGRGDQNAKTGDSDVDEDDDVNISSEEKDELIDDNGEEEEEDELRKDDSQDEDQIIPKRNKNVDTDVDMDEEIVNQAKSKEASSSDPKRRPYPVSTSSFERSDKNQGDSQRSSQIKNAAGKNLRRSSRIKPPETSKPLNSSNPSDLPSLTPPVKRKKTEEKGKKQVSAASKAYISPLKFVSHQSARHEVIDLTVERLNDEIVADKIDGVIEERTEFAEGRMLYPPDNTSPEYHRAAFHFSEDVEWYNGMMEAFEKTYIGGKPRYLTSPETSAIRIIPMDEFAEMSDRDVQNALASHHIVLTGGKKEAYGFDPDGFEDLGSLDQPIVIHDMSIPVVDNPNSRHRSGILADMYEAAQSSRGKALNSLDFPMDFATHPPKPLATDVRAWNGTNGPHNRSHAYPTKSMRWGLVATSGAHHKWHLDTDGIGAYAEVKVGEKLWFVAAPKSKGNFDSFASRHLYHGKYDIDKANSHLWDVEAVLLTPGTRLIMRPNTPHAVYTPKPCIAHGGSYLSTKAIKDTCYGAYHTFASWSTVANTDNSLYARLLLRRIMEFYAKTLGKVCFDAKRELISRSDLDHTPDIASFGGLLDVVTLYNFMELANVTTPKFYGNENASRERHAAIDGRKIARSLIETIFCHYELVDAEGTPIPADTNFILPYLAKQAKCLLAYKYAAERKGAFSCEADCTYDAVVMALRRYCINNEAFVTAFNECRDFDSFAWVEPVWSIRKKSTPLTIREHDGCTYDDSVWLKQKVKIVTEIPELEFPWEENAPSGNAYKSDSETTTDDDQPPPLKKPRRV